VTLDGDVMKMPFQEYTLDIAFAYI